MDINTLAKKLHVLEAIDKSDFQRRARILQSLWREEQGFPPGEHHWKSRSGEYKSRPLGSRLPMPLAKDTLVNFLTEPIRNLVRSEVCDPPTGSGKLFARPRIFNDLLSSQPLCFNLFGELAFDLPLASTLISDLTDGRFTEVTSVAFEHSPGRGDPRYLNDRSAFDVFLQCRTPSGAPAFIGIEVKYHENLVGNPGEHKQRYDEVADQMGCCVEDRNALQDAPLQQIWRDHLLAGITRIADGFEDGLFVMLYPRDNPHVSDAVAAYRTQLTDQRSFAAWTLENLVGNLRKQSDSQWIDAFNDRYLAFEKIDLIAHRTSVIFSR